MIFGLKFPFTKKLQLLVLSSEMSKNIGPHELVGRNVSGVRGKKPLDGRKIGKIKETVNQFYPARTAEALET
jgi:hypothetical protein